jgi:hypothetical protein
MEITWQYIYVPEGQDEPDKFGRWAVAGYIDVHIMKALPQYKQFSKVNKYIDVGVAWIMKSTNPKYKYQTKIPSFWEAANLGFGERYIYSNDLEEMKTKIKEELELIQKVFKNCK